VQAGARLFKRAQAVALATGLAQTSRTTGHLRLVVAAQFALLFVLAVAAVHTATIHFGRALSGAVGNGGGQRHDRASALRIAIAPSLAPSLQQVSAR